MSHRSLIYLELGISSPFFLGRGIHTTRLMLYFEVIRSHSASHIVNSLRLVSASLTLPQFVGVGKKGLKLYAGDLRLQYEKVPPSSRSLSSRFSFVLLRHSLLTMNFKDRLLGRPSVDDRSARESLALPKFSFEGDDHPLVSTERLFRQWQQEENSGYEAGHEIMEEGLRKGEEIVVGVLGLS